jgi:hypothetical protein
MAAGSCCEPADVAPRAVVLHLIEEVRFAFDSPLEEAVQSELVSEVKFPAGWENTGNFASAGTKGRVSVGNPAVITAA